MAEIEYMLTHQKKDCGYRFAPNTKAIRLMPEEYRAKQLKYQDLLEGFCPKCHVKVKGWIGIDYLDTPVQYVGINEDKFEHWDLRVALYQDTFVPNGASVVNGSIFDAKSMRWRNGQSMVR